MTLVQQLAAADSGALVEYRALLARDSSPQAGDADRLRAIMAQVGLSPEDVRNAAAAVAHAQRLETAIAELPELEKQRVAAGRAMSVFGEESRRIAYERAQHQTELDGESGRADIKVKRVREKTHELHAHRAAHARLFGDARNAAASAAAPQVRLGPQEVTDLAGDAAPGIYPEYGSAQEHRGYV